MIQMIGFIEVLLFYAAYFLKLFNQKRRGIKTNQLGKGNKSNKAIIIESLLRFSSAFIVAVMLISIVLNTSIVPFQVIRYMGLVLFGFGICFFIIAMITMRDNWRAGIPAGDKTEMVTGGIYKISRNPAFLGFDLTYIGVSLTFGNMLLIILAVLLILLIHLQILEEEKFLELAFGSNYITYKNKVGRYFIDI